MGLHGRGSKQMAWTRFMDMHSGGGTKVYALADGTFAEGSNRRAPEGGQPKEYIYIEASAAEAKVIFYNRFGHNPERVTCTCCGDDYSISEEPTLEQASGYDRNCEFDEASGGYVERARTKYNWSGAELVSIADYIERPNVLIIRAEQISPEQRVGDVPAQGFVWVG